MRHNLNHTHFSLWIHIYVAIAPKPTSLVRYTYIITRGHISVHEFTRR